VGRSAREAARRAVKVDPVGRGPGRWTARAVQVRDEDGRKGAFPPPGREMRKKKIPFSDLPVAAGLPIQGAGEDVGPGVVPRRVAHEGDVALVHDPFPVQDDHLPPNGFHVRSRLRRIGGTINYLYREARFSDGIVFFDECDDVFTEGTTFSRHLLIEIERSRVITILATNRPRTLDPAMERRITRIVNFPPPWTGNTGRTLEDAAPPLCLLLLRCEPRRDRPRLPAIRRSHQECDPERRAGSNPNDGHSRRTILRCRLPQ